MTGEEYSQGNALEVEDGIITWIGTINPFQKLNDNMENINLNGAYVLPGFLDFESHSYFAEFFNAVSVVSKSFAISFILSESTSLKRKAPFRLPSISFA